MLLALLLAAASPVLPPPPAAATGASGSIDPVAATRAYIDTLPAEQRARSNAYFEGGYWLELWNTLWAAGVFLLLLFTGASAKWRDMAERWVRAKPLQTAIYWVGFLVATTALSFPLSIYRDWYREHQYGLSNLTFGGWLAEEGKGLIVGAIAGSLAVTILYAVVRRLGRTWWIWGT